ncbi:MAG: DUF3800 domain-containing protein [Chloroflexota bacterium]|nr:DUF3800 domain-containing protein [Chloroflexota bacterium]MDE2960124.1 DUF3800 domain-containing protein [Chloroflexota bacterium]
MNTGDFILFSDESGNPNPKSVDPNYPIFVRIFCVFRQDHYSNIVAPAFANLKSTHLGDPSIILHEREIRLAEPPFDFQGDEPKRQDFMRELGDTIAAANFTMVAAIVDKRQQLRVPNQASALDRLAFNACMVRIRDFLNGCNQATLPTPVVVEAQGRQQDDALRQELWSLSAQWHTRGRTSPRFQASFDDKKSNTVGVQIADLAARPVGTHILRPQQVNRAWDVLQPKLYCDPQGNTGGWGLITIPSRPTRQNDEAPE